MIYSERTVNGEVTDEFSNNHKSATTLRKMPPNREEAVGGYIRARLRELEQTSPRGWQVEFARAAGFGPSVVAQVKRGLGVGTKTGPGFARALGFSSYDDLRDAAYRWWQMEGRAPAASAAALSGPAVEAIEAVLAIGTGTKAQLEAIAAAYAHPRFLARDRGWWIQTLLAELRADEELAIAARRERASRVRRSSSTPPARRRS